MKNFYDWQKKAFKKGVSALRLCLNVSCGLGKTLVIASLAITKDKPVIIIAPKNLCNQWRDEFLELGVKPEDIWVHDQVTQTRNTEKYLKEFAKWVQK